MLNYRPVEVLISALYRWQPTITTVMSHMINQSSSHAALLQKNKNQKLIHRSWTVSFIQTFDTIMVWKF